MDTFTIEFEDIDDPYHGKANESLAARETSEFIGSNHHNVPVTSEDFRSSLEDFVKYGDLPFSVSSGLGIMAVSKAARDKGIKVLLTEMGLMNVLVVIHGIRIFFLKKYSQKKASYMKI